MRQQMKFWPDVEQLIRTEPLVLQMQSKVTLLEKNANMHTLFNDLPGQQLAMVPALVQNGQASVCRPQCALQNWRHVWY